MTSRTGRRAPLAARRAALLAALVPAAAGCAGAARPGAQQSATDAAAQAAQPRGDTVGVDLVPAGFGTLRQEDVALRLQLQGVLVRAIPLNESIIRVLSPDSYRALRDLAESRRDAIARVAARHRVREPQVWYVSFYGLEPEARFSPMELVVSSGGRDFRPLEVLALTAGFGEQRLRQRETQAALYVFEDGINVEQPLALSVEGARNDTWQTTLRTIDRERALIRTRAGQVPPPR